MPIGKANVGSNFMGLARYLRSGSNHDAPERVAWIETRNLLTERLETAARIMEATAHQNPRVEKPVYHLSISWPEEDQPSREDMRRTADRLLADLALEEHQAVLVAHNDTRHPHVHLMVNRVHPEILKSWDRRHDWRRIDQSLHRQEQERQWRQVPRRHLGHQRIEEARPTSGERQQARRLGTPTPAQEIRDRAREVMRTAKSWPQLEYRLHQ
jgi:hypothetical protein